MRNEVLRMERVTYKEDEVVKLEDFNLQIFQGEVMGFLPVNSHGKTALLKLLERNLPLYDGYIYYGGEKVNTWKENYKAANRISIIQEKSSLAGNLNIADNIFVTASGLSPVGDPHKDPEPADGTFLEDIGMDIPLNKDVEKLSTFERIIVELLRAVIMGYHLIVLDEVGALVSDDELKKLHGIIRRYVKKGFSFLYICSHLEEISSICDRCALFTNGRIQKILEREELFNDPPVTYMTEYNDMVRYHTEKREGQQAAPVVFQWKGYGEDAACNFSFDVHKGECLAVQIMDARGMEELRKILTGDILPESGEILLNGKQTEIPGNCRIAVIQERTTKTMIFPELDYMNNLCICLAEKVPSIWHNKRLQKSIRNEYSPILGSDVFEMPVEELSEKQKYQLVYTRVLLQKPEILFCIQPFCGADLAHRMFIWVCWKSSWIKRISVVILSLNLSIPGYGRSPVDS